MDGIILSLITRTTQGGIATISVVLTMLQLSLMTFFSELRPIKRHARKILCLMNIIILVADNCKGLDIHIKLKSQLEQLPCLSYKKLGNVGLKANFFFLL